MPRVFSFERELYATLDLMPLTVRRKLDLAGLKLPLAGWQALPLDERRALALVAVEDEASVAAFAATLREVAARAGARLDPLPPAEPPWRTREVPARVREALGGTLDDALDDATWAGLDDEARFALVHLAGKRREPAQLRAALVELGLAPV
jgi:hypothetical protein